MDTPLHACLTLIRTKNIGVTRFFELIDHYETAERALKALPELERHKKLSFSIDIPSQGKINNEINATHATGARFITYFDPLYPDALKHIPDPPPVLIVKGNIDLLNQPKIALIGSRNASLNGQHYTSKLAKELGAQSYICVSGLARGIDSAAHQASLKTGTIGVIAGGIDHIYPSENTALFNQMYEKGLVITEMPIGSKAKAQDFPRRNRIVAGLSLGVVVIEAALKSGSLITARLANEYGRDVFSVPGSPLDPRSEGTNKLIQNGAKLIQSVNDILEDITPLTKPYKESAPQNSLDFSSEPQSIKDEPIPTTTTNKLDTLILDILDHTPIETDLIIRKIANTNNISPEKCLKTIISLEFSGAIIRHSGNKISKA